jgi:type I restriction enzyme S subunit
MTDRITEILEGWKLVSIKEIADINPIESIKKGEVVKYVAMENLAPFTRKIVNFTFKEYHGGMKFKNGDTLLARITPCLENGKASYVDILNKNEVGFGSTEYIVFREKSNLSDGKFLYYLSISPKFREMAIKTMTGSSGRQRIQTDLLVNKKQLIPSLSEQQAIAAVLSSLDDKIELLREQNKTLEAIARAIFKRWFVDFEFPDETGKPYKSSGGKMFYNGELDKEIPDGWGIEQIGGKIKTVLGGTPNRRVNSYWNNGNIAWINSGAINNFPIITPSELITEAGLNNSAAKIMPIRTVVLPFVISIGQNVPISILGINASGNQSVLGLMENDDFSAEYIYFWMQHIKTLLYSHATGGAQQHINKQNVDDLIILSPKKSTLKKFNDLCMPMFDRIFNNARGFQILSQLRDALLPKLMSGKIRVAGFSDEN